jgi:hypothetical protein
MSRLGYRDTRLGLGYRDMIPDIIGYPDIGYHHGPDIGSPDIGSPDIGTNIGIYRLGYRDQMSRYRVIQVEFPDIALIWNPDHLNRIWQIGTDVSEPCTDMFVLVQECKTCTCLYHVHTNM